MHSSKNRAMHRSVNSSLLASSLIFASTMYMTVSMSEGKKTASKEGARLIFLAR
jgi:hypothetical protein